MYRKLTPHEIECLENQQCTADDWGNIEVSDNFLSDYVKNVCFSGKNQLGKFEKNFRLENGVERHSGIFNAAIHNCIIENDVYIAAIHNVIANYEIKKDCFITNVGTLSSTQGTSFGNGVMVAAVNENGGRKIPIFDRLSAQIAHILVFYRQFNKFSNKVFEKIDVYCNSLKACERGVIGERTKILNCKAILNVKIGENATVSGAELLENGTINSDFYAKTLVGAGVIAKDFIIGKSAKITDGASIERCFVGEGSIVSKQFSATDCLFFANCEMLNGEAVSVFAAPHTVSHHKSSLMIACGLSFANIGSGTNMSNHAYKLGAVHQGFMARGCKFASNSYLLFPAQTGAFTVILGAHKNHPNIEDLPFSYLVEENGDSFVVPGINIFRTGVLRDVEKWKKRDRRTHRQPLDIIHYELINPMIINKIENGLEILKKIKSENPNAEIYEYGNCKIHKNSLRKGIEYYQDALTVFCGDFLLNIQNINKIKTSPLDFSEWIDLAGFVVPKAALLYILAYILNNAADLKKINAEFINMNKDYDAHLNIFINNWFLKKKINPKEALEKYIAILTMLEKRLQKETSSEFFCDAKISYGVDMMKYKDCDFEEVRGNFSDNEFIKSIPKIFSEKIEKAKLMLNSDAFQQLN
jgi:carbonic anhydrase/acetyltransferase-like protein (isoleucine patch superfamily)/tetratricopeptide (TPR) repeat protein